MSDQRDKAVRFTFQVDQRSLEVARNAIRQLTAEVKQLVETMARAGGGMGQGVSGLGGIFGGFSAKAGGINASREATLKGANPLTQSVAADAKALSVIAKAGTDALRSLSSTSRQSIGDQIANIERLKKSVLDLERAYDSLGNVVAKPGSRAGRNLDALRLEKEVELSAMRQQLASAQAGFGGSATGAGGIVGRGQKVVNRGGIDYVVDEPGPKVPGAMSRLWGALNQQVPGTAGLGGMLSKFSPALGALGLPAIGMALPFAAHAYLTNAYLGREGFEASEALQAGTDPYRRRAAISQSLGGLGMSVRRDVNMALAAGSVTPTQLRTAFGPETMKAMIDQAKQASGASPSASAGAKRIADAIGNKLSEIVNGGAADFVYQQAVNGPDAAARSLRNAVINGTPQEVRTPEWQAKLDRMTGDIGMSMAGRYSDLVRMNREAQSVRESTYMSEFDQGYLGRMQLMRQAGLGGEYQIRRPGVGYNNVEYLRGNRAQLLGAGTPYTAEEVAGAMGGIGSAAGRRFMSEGLGVQMLRYQYGGLGNAPALYGAAAGYGGPGAFMAALSGASGRGAGLVDTTATGQIGDLMAGAMTGGDFYTNGAAGAQGLLSTAALFGGDLRSARGAGMGYAANAGYSGGRTDRLQQAINVLASVRQGGTLYSQEALRNMSPALRMDLMRRINGGGKFTMPAELAAQGVTTDMLKGYGAERDRYLFAEYMNKQGTPGVNQVVDAWRQSGAASLRGLHGADLRSAITKLGVAAMQAGRAPTVEAGKHLIAQIAAEDPAIFAALKSGGIGDVAATSEEARHKIDRDANILDRESVLSSQETKDKIRTGSSSAAMGLAAGLDQMSTVIGQDGKRMHDALQKLVDAFDEARIAIEGRHRMRSTPPGQGE